LQSTICASASTCANLCSPASKYYNKVQCAKLEADWMKSGRAEGRVYGCVTPAEALCYGNNYDNLRESMCNGTACATVQQAKQLESHYFRLGKAEGKTFGCVGGSVDALCYGNRYPELQTKFCDGGACHGVRVGDLLKQHYEEWGRFQGRQFGCPSASSAEDMCLGYTLEAAGARDAGRIRNALATTGISSGDFHILRFTAWTVPKPTGKPVAKAGPTRCGSPRRCTQINSTKVGPQCVSEVHDGWTKDACP